MTKVNQELVFTQTDNTNNNNNNNNNNNVHLSCAHQRPERSHDTY